MPKQWLNKAGVINKVVKTGPILFFPSLRLTHIIKSSLIKHFTEKLLSVVESPDDARICNVGPRENVIGLSFKMPIPG